MKKFEKENSIYFECTYRNFDGVVTEPTTPRYMINDTKGNEEASGTPTQKEDGVYYFYWASSVADTYRVIFTGTVGGQNGVARQLFKVVETKIR